MQASTTDTSVLVDGYVPVIDISPARGGSLEARTDVAKAIGRACEESGFLVIVGHGVDQALVDDMYKVTETFFRLPDEEKEAVSVRDGGLRGWKREGGYVAAASGIETLPDLCELFTYNRLGDPGVAETSGLGDHLEELNGANQFPVSPHGFEETWRWRFREDESRIRGPQIRDNVAWLNRLALSLLKQHPEKNSIAMKRQTCAWDDDYLLQVLTGIIP